MYTVMANHVTFMKCISDFRVKTKDVRIMKRAKISMGCIRCLPYEEFNRSFRF